VVELSAFIVDQRSAGNAASLARSSSSAGTVAAASARLKFARRKWRRVVGFLRAGDGFHDTSTPSNRSFDAGSPASSMNVWHIGPPPVTAGKPSQALGLVHAAAAVRDRAKRSPVTGSLPPMSSWTVGPL